MLLRRCETTVSGTGVGVPTIVISAFARRSYIDQTEYETVSILKLLEFRFNLAPLAARDADPAVNVRPTRTRGVAMGVVHS
jgi:hypothetical protein